LLIFVEYLQERLALRRISSKKVNTTYKSREEALLRATKLDPFSDPEVYKTLHLRGLQETSEGIFSIIYLLTSGVKSTYDPKLSFDLPDLIAEDQVRQIVESIVCPVLLLRAKGRKLVSVFHYQRCSLKSLG
jgi:hypothetical protein